MVEDQLPEKGEWEAMQKHCKGDIECLFFANLNGTSTGIAIYGNNEAVLRRMLPSMMINLSDKGVYACAGPLVITKHKATRGGNLIFYPLEVKDENLIQTWFDYPTGGEGPNGSTVRMELFP